MDVALSEARESYEVDILDGSGVVRTLTTSTPNTTYGASQQVEDFGGIQASVSLHIYQLSERVGRGWPLITVV